jgi:hypothetical protein
MSSCLSHDDRLLVHKVDSDVGQYAYLPTFLLNFAYHLQVDLGFCLLDRCARHACDPKIESLYECSADLFKHKGR